MKKVGIILSSLLVPLLACASEADLKIPNAIKDEEKLYWGFLITIAGLIFGLYQFIKVKKLPSHSSMLDVSEVIFQTCFTYIKQQGKFLAILFLFIGISRRNPITTPEENLF